MVELSLNKLQNSDFSVDKNPYPITESNYLYWEIGYFGSKAVKFNTIDTYAKKLSFNKSIEELDRLKLAISIFFTIWQLSEDTEFKDKKRYPDFIDRRYVNLLAALLEDNYPSNPVLPKNINVVSWNYDLQFEFAYKSFCRDEKEWREIEKTLHFTSKYKDQLQVCHLNGYHGYYSGGRGEVDILDRTKNNKYVDILENIIYTSNSVFEQKIKFHDHINYAWENESEIAKQTRKRAKQIFAATDLLIIVGYSFPPFNKEIDKDLFSALKTRELSIIYQDPNASLSILKNLMDTSTIYIDLLTTKLDNFYFPY